MFVCFDNISSIFNFFFINVFIIYQYDIHFNFFMSNLSDLMKTYMNIYCLILHEPFIFYLIIFFSFLFFPSALQESLRTLDLIAESIPEVLTISAAVLAAVKSVKINTEENKNGNETESNRIEGVSESVKMDVETVTTEIKPLITMKQLHLLTNNISVLYATNTEFLLLREISDALTAYHIAVSSWSERTALLIPQKSTRSKMSKDLKTTSKADLEEVREGER
jgi:hypothetical protein